jgi:hypothetical protein
VRVARLELGDWTGSVPPVTEVFETTDVDVAESMLAAAYGTLRIRDVGRKVGCGSHRRR